MEVFWAHQLLVIGRMMLSKVVRPIVDAFVPVDPELSLLLSIIQWKRLLNELLRFWRMLLFRNSSVVALSVFNGMGPCMCPVLDKVVMIGAATFPFWWTVPTSASAADDMSLRKVTYSVKIGPLGVGG